MNQKVYNAMCKICGLRKELDLDEQNKAGKSIFMEQFKKAINENKKLVSLCVICGGKMEWRLL